VAAKEGEVLLFLTEEETGGHLGSPNLGGKKTNLIQKKRERRKGTLNFVCLEKKGGSEVPLIEEAKGERKQ